MVTITVKGTEKDIRNFIIFLHHSEEYKVFIQGSEKKIGENLYEEELELRRIHSISK